MDQDIVQMHQKGAEIEYKAIEEKTQEYDRTVIEAPIRPGNKNRCKIEMFDTPYAIDHLKVINIAELSKYGGGEKRQDHQGNEQALEIRGNWVWRLRWHWVLYEKGGFKSPLSLACKLF
ncbi:hypothetical protein [Geobacter sp. SVR]|uniref:hypothetical protein n=1 Tax=Geobacter sp. SVR TaxID=2495594 RepID=UPI00143EFFBA|nr:hypothetical protein [Geobacter sp. SVR]BCS53796.1 hypothetical protein GSVR_21040 [Geobacter sp. SVR]GCF85695.1 hypothetical protein GSbR_22950 [Geobacter sp. SVR]